MFDDFDSSQEAHIPEPDLVPILDALTCVIFFLILSTTFIEMTKLTLPPSQTTVNTDPVAPPPIAAKFFAKVENNFLSLKIQWGGAEPSSLTRSILRKDVYTKDLEDAAAAITNDFANKFPNEKSIQLSLSADANYQEMISLMDGIRTKLNDIVLISYKEVL
ncbi:MAG: biopolymer transporter ExbD [Pseudobdellovibrionaceae bacterium]